MKTKDARQLLDHIAADIEAIERSAGLTRSEVLFDPIRAFEALLEIGRETARLRRRIAEDLEPMLERRERATEADSLAEQVAALTQRVAALEHSAATRITPLRREG